MMAAASELPFSDDNMLFSSSRSDNYMPMSQGVTFDEVTHADEAGDDEDDSDFEEETLGERLLGLTEMFPEWLRNATGSVLDGAMRASRSAYGFSRNFMWFAAYAATLCALPLMLEMERNQMEEQEASEHRSMMLGPGGVGGQGLPGFQANVPMLSPVSVK